MSKVNFGEWKFIIKLVIAIATALLGVMGGQQASTGDNE